MKCPKCGEHSKDDWAILDADTSLDGVDGLGFLRAPHALVVGLQWMHCSDRTCGELVIQIQTVRHHPGGGGPVVQQIDRWIAYPRFVTASKPVDPLVPDDLRADYNEAAAILDLSPRMSAVLSRRILGDLLERYAKIKHKSLAKQIDLFASDPAHPRRLREGLHHFREVADFSAHTQTDEHSQEIIDVGHDEAEWTLDRVDDLFEYFIVDPDREAKIIGAMDKKIADAGRKTIPPLPPDPEVPSS